MTYKELRDWATGVVEKSDDMVLDLTCYGSRDWMARFRVSGKSETVANGSGGSQKEALRELKSRWENGGEASL